MKSARAAPHYIQARPIFTLMHTILHDLPIYSNINKIYDAITQPAHLVNWWPLKCTGSPALGEIYNFNFTDEYDWYTEVAEVVHDKAIYFKMTKADDDWNPTSFGFELLEHEDHTLVKFSHSKWASTNAHYRRTSYCWAVLLKGLKDYLEQGVVVPFEERS